MGNVPECDRCGVEVMLPFTCAYCDGTYCAEHRIPESHHCPHRPTVPPPYLTTYDNTEPSEKPRIAKEPRMKRKQFSTKKAVALFLVVVIAGVIIWSVYPSLLQSTQNQSVAPTPSTTPSTPSTTPPSTTPSNTVPETYSHEELIGYVLSLINSDRQSKGLQDVTLSSIDSGQRHADEMLENRYFSHWDIQGYKPYMRYTLAGGEGSVAENCAAQLGYYSDLMEALRGIEWGMMYDDAASKWGHRDNILDPFHNKVSIGVAYDNNDIYLVQDFEDDYVSWSALYLSNQVRMQGTIVKAGESISQVAIYFDNPTSLTAQQLENSPYDGGYDAGTYVGMVVSPPPPGSQYEQPREGILIIANMWSVAGQSFNVNFDLSAAFIRWGKGVYTLYLWTDSHHLTTLSIWR